jgi:lipoprotein signal peptidase
MSLNHSSNSDASESTPEIASAAEPVRSESAITDPASHARLWLVAGVGLAADLLSKHWAFTRLDPNPTSTGWVAIKNLVAFRRSLNPGALFGLGKGLTPIFIGASVLALAFVLLLFFHSGRRRWSLHIALGLVLAGALGNLYDRAFMIADVVKFTQKGLRGTCVGKIISRPGESPMLIAPWPEGAEGARKYAMPIWPGDNAEVRQMGVVRDFVKIEPHFQVGKYTVDVWPWVFNVADVMLVLGVSLLMLNFWWERRQERAAALRSGADAHTARAPPATE